MSRAFVKETDEADLPDQLRDVRISPHRNLVTANGLALIKEAMLFEAQRLKDARANGEEGEAASALRELRYWSARETTAELTPPPSDTSTARFGHRVTLQSDGEEPFSFVITGEDEAAPYHGRVSYVSPLARSVIGNAVGDVVPYRDKEVVIVEISVPDAT